MQIDPSQTDQSPDPRGAGRLRVLDTIRRAAPIARIDISRRTGLSPATVTTITAELLQAGLIAPIIADDVQIIGRVRGVIRSMR